MLVGLLVANAALAQADRVGARVEVYTDRNATRVVRPRASFDVGVRDGHRLTGSYAADVITSASVDVVTRASQTVHETRHDGTLGYGRVRERDATQVSYAYGHEPDYRSHGGRVTHGRDLDATRQTRLELAAGMTRGRVGVVGDPDFVRHATTFSFSAALTRVFTQRSLGRLAVELAHVHGFQSSAYRTVRLGDWTAHRSDGSDPEAPAYVFEGITGVAREHHPDDRFRARLVLDGVVDVGRGVALAASTAGYADTFGVRAAEGTFEVRVEPRPRLLLRLGGRAYFQSAAWFYRARYLDSVQTRGYLSDDKELGRMRSYTLHTALQVPAGPVRLEARVELTRYEYPTFTLLRSNEALVVSLGASYQR